MSEAYRIRDWDANYETNRTRILKTLTWLALPIKLGGEGYADLMDHERGPAHFGCWIALLEAASQCKPRGTLVRASGRPYDVTSLARMCRIPALLMQEAIERLVSIGWVETWHHDGGVVPESGINVPESRQHRKTGRPEDIPEDRSVDRDSGLSHRAAPSSPSATASGVPAPVGNGATTEPGLEPPESPPAEGPAWEVYRDGQGRTYAKPPNRPVH